MLGHMLKTGLHDLEFVGQGLDRLIFLVDDAHIDHLLTFHLSPELCLLTFNRQDSSVKLFSQLAIRSEQLSVLSRM